MQTSLIWQGSPTMLIFAHITLLTHWCVLFFTAYGITTRLPLIFIQPANSWIIVRYISLNSESVCIFLCIYVCACLCECCFVCKLCRVMVLLDNRILISSILHIYDTVSNPVGIDGMCWDEQYAWLEDLMHWTSLPENEQCV